MAARSSASRRVTLKKMSRFDLQAKVVINASGVDIEEHPGDGWRVRGFAAGREPRNAFCAPAFFSAGEYRAHDSEDGGWPGAVRYTVAWPTLVGTTDVPIDQSVA